MPDIFINGTKVEAGQVWATEGRGTNGKRLKVTFTKVLDVDPDDELVCIPGPDGTGISDEHTLHPIKARIKKSWPYAIYGSLHHDIIFEEGGNIAFTAAGQWSVDDEEHLDFKLSRQVKKKKKKKVKVEA